MRLDCNGPALQPPSSSAARWFQPERAWALPAPPPRRQRRGDELLLHKANFHSLEQVQNVLLCEQLGKQ